MNPTLGPQFPFQVRMSVPLRIEDREPAGLSVQQVEGEAPSSGHRRRPSFAASEAPSPGGQGSTMAASSEQLRRILEQRRNIMLYQPDVMAA